MSTIEEPEFDYHACFDKQGLDPHKIHGKAEREKRLQAVMERTARKKDGCQTNTTNEPEFDYYTYLKEYEPKPSQIHQGPAEREKHLQAVMECKRVAKDK